MKKLWPLLGGVGLFVALLLLGSSQEATPRRFDERVTLRSRDKIPYGTNAAFTLLPELFPKARVVRENKPPEDWDSVSTYRTGQAVVLVADYFDASPEELNQLASFVENGNYVFLLSRSASEDVEVFFATSFASFTDTVDRRNRRLHMQLTTPPFNNNTDYSYPGKSYGNLLYRHDSTAKAVTLGENGAGLANFARLDKGRGSFFLHSAPLAFSNYFLLHKGNTAYFESVFSVLPPDLNTIAWNEYYLEKPANQKEPNWLGALFSYPAFKNGLLLAAATLLLFLLLGMRRRQRLIPPYERPANDSLDFVKTLGRLYYDRRDHQNLAAKMATYFLEHVRSRYKLPTHTLDADFIQALHAKSGYAEGELKMLVATVQYVQDVSFLPEAELAAFYRQLEAFYQTT